MKTKAASSEDLIDDPVNLGEQPIWVYSGVLDTVVLPEVVNYVPRVYQYWGANVQYVNRFQGEHTFPTNLSQNTNFCSFLGSPYIANCNWDGAGSLFHKVIPDQDTKPLKNRVMDWKSAGTFQEFDQAEFSTDFANSSLDEKGFIYIPNNCKSGDSPHCMLHLVFHGCSQGRKFLDTYYAQNTGYLEWAAANDLVLLFPQNAGMTGNPGGCWDFWGYTNQNYTDKKGIQTSAVKNMVDRVLAKPATKQNTFVY